MRKSAFIILTCIIASMSVYAETSEIIDALKTCSPYTESGTLNTEGMNVQSTKRVEGWQGDKCLYKEKINFSGISATTTCRFTKAQINEIISVTNAFSLVQQYSGESIDTSSLDAVQNNPVVKVWNKYLQDGSTCSVEAN